MLSSTVLFLLSSVLPSLASPTPSLDQRAAALTCSGFSVPDESISFTLLAVGQTNDSFRQPLALDTIAGVTVLASPDILNESFITNFTLLNSGLYSDPQGWISNAVPSGGLLSFTSSATGTVFATYCEGFNTDPHGEEFPYELSLGSLDYGDFALCTGSNDAGVIVYAPVNGTTDPYDAGTCVPVVIHPIHDCC